MSISPSSTQRGHPVSVLNRVDDTARLEALRRYDILDTEPEPAFDRITELAAHLFEAPTAIVNFVDANRQWFKSTVGLAEDETGLDVSFCVYTVEKGEVFVVENLAEDERFADNPYVTEHGVRFYAGAPLITPDDRRLGTLCVLDTQPRSPSEAALDRLADLAAMVVDELELRRERSEHEQSRELLRHSQELAQVGGWAYDPETDTLSWTDETYRIHDLSPATGIDVDSALDFYVPEDRPVIESHVERLLEEGGQYDLELTIKTAEGTRKRVRTMGRAQRTDGKVTQITGAIQDITEAHEQEEALQKSEDRWQQLVDRHPGPIHVSIDGEYAYANRATVELLGVESVDDLMGRDMSDFVHPEERDLLRERNERLYEDRDEAELTQTRIQRPDGTVRTILVRSVPIQYEGRDAAQTMMWDVTDQKEMERELRRSEEKFRAVVENAQPMTFMVDRDGTILLSEGEDLQRLGLQPGETVGESVYDRYANNPEVINAMERALDGERVDEEVHVDGLIFDTWYSPFYNEEGEVAGVIGMAADITERRHAQIELRRQKEMLQTLFDNVPVMITLGRGDQFELANAQFEKVTGWAQENITDASMLLEKLYPDPEVRGEVAEFVENQPDEWRDFPLQTKEGEVVDTTWTNVALSDGRWIGIGLDISDRKTWERELEESYQRLRLALDAANAGTFEYDVATDRVLWDGRSLELYGMHLDSGTQDADRLGALVLDEDLDRLNGVFDQAIEEGQTRYDVSYRIRRADDGELRHIQSHGLVLRDEDGTAERVIGINRDVTEQNERREQLRLLETAIEQSPATVLITKADGPDAPGPTTVYANPAFTEITGYDRDDIIGKSPRMLQGPDTDRAALDRIRAALEHEEPVREVVLNYAKDGTPYWNDLYIAPVRDEEGAVTHHVSIQQDATERRRRKETLERQNDLFSMAQSLARVGGWEYDVQTGDSMVTDEVKRIHRLSPDDELAPERSISFYHPEDQETIRTAFMRAVEEGEPYDLELRLITDGGTKRWVRTQGKPRHEDGEVVRVRGTLQDVTERVRRRNELEAAKEAAEEADRIKAALLSNMNHEFRTPLTSILTFSELIRDNPDVADRFIGRILGGGKRLLYTLNTVMDFAELEGDNRSVTPRSFPLEETVRSVVNDFREKAQQNDIDLVVDVSEAAHSVALDQHLVERILTHLVHNAVKFTNEGQVTLSARTNGTAVFRVTDAGVGIEPDFLPKVFDEFAQASSGYDRTHEGNGLGLTVVKRFVEAMDGTIDVESEPEEGTAVTVRLPLKNG